ncbi:MAG TPA: hypothetical protein VM142_11090 [Acidimicrobiales bacterium]|nr:hypothetical protein [Acidimicrobiales bacterium]
MPTLLDGAHAKLRRAREQAELLKIEMRTAEQTCAPLVVARSKVDHETKRLIATLTHVAQLPSDWGIRIGEIAHNFRGVLDHLAYLCVLTETNGRVPSDPEGIAFPITDSPAKLQSRERLRKQISSNGWAFIEAAQPYQGWDGGEFLPILRDLSNHDKHRLIQPALLGAAEWVTRIKAEGNGCRIALPRSQANGISMTGRPLEPETEVFSAAVEITGSNPTMEVEFHTAAYISLPNGLGVEATLDGIGNAITQLVASAHSMFTSETIGDQARDLPRRIESAHRLAPRPGVSVTVREVRTQEGSLWWEVLEPG